MREAIEWLDEVLQYTDRFKIEEIGDGIYRITQVTGEIIQEGTPIDADNLNLMDKTGLHAMATALLNSEMLSKLQQKVEGFSDDNQVAALYTALFSSEQLAKKNDESAKNTKANLITAMFNAEMTRKALDKVDAIDGEHHTVTLTNTESYPFNNSEKTIAFSRVRNAKNYTVLCEVTSKTGESVGDIVIYDKMLNGFKIRYTGAATSVTMNIAVIGGI